MCHCEEKRNDTIYNLLINRQEIALLCVQQQSHIVKEYLIHNYLVTCIATYFMFEILK